jgi:peptidoglycan/LPS O-acetylase OafA/YrhL
MGQVSVGSAGGEPHGPSIKGRGGRLLVLDGWRAISILLVLAAHMLPMGPSRFAGNEAAGMLGMSLFFTLSGFLITEQLYTRRNLAAFFVRRLFRIVPLAWIYVSFVALLLTVSPVAVVAHLLFAVNYATASMTPITAHFWSLCVEVHFYLAIATLMAITRFRGFRLLPVAWLGFVVLRACLRPAGTIETHFRVDEILSGSCLALVHLGEFGPRIRALVAQLPFLLLAALLVVASHPNAGVFDAFRSLLAATLVGRTLFATDDSVFIRGLRSRALRYVAEISYALYVIHPLTMWGWLGSGSKFAKYAKRPLSFLLTFGLAHLSTFYFERPILKLGKRLAAQIETGAALRVVTAPSPEP